MSWLGTRRLWWSINYNQIDLHDIMNTKNLNSTIPVITILLCAIIGGGLLAYASRGGIGVESDTASYYSAARNLTTGEGFGIYYPSGRFVFFSYWAPLYALLLAGLSYLPVSTFEIVRWLNVILFSLMIVMVGFHFFHLSRSFYLSVLVCILIAFSPLFTRVYVYAMSEPLFFGFVLAGLFSAFLYFEKNRPFWFYLSAIFTALAMLTRYTAIPLVLTILLGLLVLLRLPLKNRIVKALEFGIISLSGIAVWFWIVWSNTGTLGGRQLILTDETHQLFNEIRVWFINRISSWLTGDLRISWMVDPHHYKPFWIGVMVLLLISSIILYKALHRKYATGWLERPGSRELLLYLSLIVLYGLFLVFSYVFSAPFGLGDRIFSPFELFSLLFLFTLAFVTIQLFTSRPYKVLIYLLLTILAGFSINKGGKNILTYPADGIGYNTHEARESVILQKINELPIEIKLISNEGPYLLFHVNKFPYRIEELAQEAPNWEFNIYGTDTSDAAQQEFNQGDAALILFPSIVNDFSILYGDQASLRVEKLTAGLYLYYSGFDGKIYFNRPPDFE
jgi:hypothetical protein